MIKNTTGEYKLIFGSKFSNYRTIYLKTIIVLSNNNCCEKGGCFRSEKSKIEYYIS